MDNNTKTAEEIAAMGDEELASAERAEAEAMAAEEAARAAAVRAQLARERANQLRGQDAGEKPDGSSSRQAPKDPAKAANAANAAAGRPAPRGLDEKPDPRPAPANARPPKKKRKGLMALVIVLLIVVGACVGAYFFFNSYFKDHFFIHAAINGEDVSFKSASQVRETLANRVLERKVTVKGRNDLTATLSGREIGVSVEDNGAVDALLRQQEGENWVMSMFHTTGGDVNLTVGLDEDTLQKAVAALPMAQEENTVEPQNATLDSSGKECVLVPENEGAKLDLEKTVAALRKAWENQSAELILDEADCYVRPVVTAQNETLNERVSAWNKILTADVTYVFGENRERVTGEDARSHIVDDGQTVKLDDGFAHDLVYAWGRKYDTFGLAREFTTHDGQVITIPYGGDYGWCINKDKTIADLDAALLSGTAGEREPVWLFKAMGWDNNDLTGTYVEVSIAQQHLWCFKDGQLIVETPVVTGSLAMPDAETHPGCFAIDAKVRDKVLGALDTQGYANPVSFWMPFDGGRGLHDAPWRVDYGGDIYVTNGSHGCVNTPYWAMEIVYNALEIGHAVVVY